MTTPTPRTDAIALDRNDSHRHPDCSDRIVGWTDYEALRDRSREIERDLAARDAELAKMLDEREGNARQFRRIQDRLAQAEVDAKFWMEVSAEQRAELLKIAENPYEGNESALDYSCTHWKQRAEAAEQERDSAVAWNHRVSVCANHTAEIVDGPCVICELEAAERKAEEAAMELQMRRTPLNAPGDEELIRQSGIQLRHCSCSGGSGDEAHADGCPLWLDVLAARQWWRDRHVVAWSCSREAKGGNRCAQWCGHQQYCNAHTRDDIEIAAIAAKGDA